MKASKLMCSVLLFLLLTSCGAKQDNDVEEGLFKGPSDVVKHLSCKKIYKHNDTNISITEEMGSEGSIETPCGGIKAYKLKPELPNLNIVNVQVEKYFLCKNNQGKATHGWVFQHDLAKGESRFTLSTANKGDYLNCTGRFTSPLPRTVVSNNDIKQIIDSRDESEIKNCEQSSKVHRLAIESCSGEWTYGANVIFTDDNGRLHLTTRKKIWNSAIY